MRSSEDFSSQTPLWPRFFALLWTALISLATLVWLFQDSLDRYWQQTYRRDSPLAPWQNAPAWAAGRVVDDRVKGVLKRLHAVLSDESLVWTVVFKRHGLSASEAKISLKAESTSEFENTPEAETTLAAPPKPGPAPAADLSVSDGKNQERGKDTPSFFLKSGQRVFFVGDSLMQGVAPHAQAALLRDYRIKSINDSKQSTGLAYPGLFDWGKTVKEAFARHDDIALMVVFLGPNDPWDMPNSRGGAYLKFKSPEWEALYRARIRNLLDTAHAHGAGVIWLQVPNMRRKKLNDDMHYLNTLYESEVRAAQGVFVPTNVLLGMSGNDFQPYTTVGDKGNVKLRLDDGIHFTPSGQRILADAVLSLVKAEPANPS